MIWIITNFRSVANKAANVAGVLWKLRRSLPKHVKKLLYQSLLESHLTYLIPVWGRANDQAIKRLQVLQNRALRNVYNLDRLINRVRMYTHMVESCLPIRSLFYLNSATLVYNITHLYTHSNIKFNRVGTRSRQRDNLRPLKSRTLYGSKSFQSFGPKIFNDIPEDIKRLSHVHGFKWALRCYIRKEEFNDVSLSSKFSAKYF